ncbi:hypothetical protein ACFRMO_08170 [Streptomyces anulatus]|uniref:hypothetical protein n=1 Tax=Streptomyces anulatus TaxID=1892 RepID=UPI0036B88670
MDLDFEVLVHHMQPTHPGAALNEPLTGAEANVRIRGLVVNSMADELWTYEVPDLKGNPLRVVARTQHTQNWGLDGPRVVREVYVQHATGGPVHEFDWLERTEYPTPKPTRQPVRVGDAVSAMPDGHSLDTGEVTSVEWKLRPMQAHYQLPPLWTWEWRVGVKFSDGRTREGRWHSDWISKA